MGKSIILDKLNQISIRQEQEVKEFKKQVSEKYLPLRNELFEICKSNKHCYDDGSPAIHTYRGQTYCLICGQDIE